MHPPGWLQGVQSILKCLVSDLLQLVHMNLGETTQTWVSLTHFPTFAQITLGHIKISFSLSEADCVHLLQSFTAVNASKTRLYFSKNKCSYFSHLFKLPYIFSTVILLIPGTKQAFCIENGFQCFALSIPINHEHWDSTVFHFLTTCPLYSYVKCITRKKTPLLQEAWQYFYVWHLCTFTVLLLNANDTYQIIYLINHQVTFSQCTFLLGE
jgi:hypothetical protein